MSATQILQPYLDIMSGHVLTGDFDGYLKGVALPFHFVTTDESIVVTSSASLRAGFDTFRQMLQSQQVTDYIRLVVNSLLLDEHLISGHYTTHVISGGTRIMAPFPSQIVLRSNAKGHWRAVSIANGVKNARWPLDRLQIFPPPPDHDQTAPQQGTDLAPD